MRLKENEILDSIVKIILNCLDTEPDEIFLFGSRARNTNKSFSDFDIGIIPQKHISFRVLQKIEDELDKLDTLKTIDIVDFSFVSKEFLKEATKNKRILYVRPENNTI